MSKGSFRVKVHLSRDANGYVKYFYPCFTRYIQKKDIVHIERFETCEEFYDWLIYSDDNGIELNKDTKFVRLINEMPNEYNEDCKCDKWCTCPLPIYPLYLILAKNKFVKEYYGANNGNEFGTPKTVFYMIHPDEREHMERFLAGTDDALYDYVEHLKYNPKNGTDYEQVKEEFKKRKINNDD